MKHFRRRHLDFHTCISSNMHCSRRCSFVIFDMRLLLMFHKTEFLWIKNMFNHTHCLKQRSKFQSSKFLVQGHYLRKSINTVLYGKVQPTERALFFAFLGWVRSVRGTRDTRDRWRQRTKIAFPHCACLTLHACLALTFFSAEKHNKIMFCKLGKKLIKEVTKLFWIE